jgi:hypothetical protein
MTIRNGTKTKVLRAVGGDGRLHQTRGPAVPKLTDPSNSVNLGTFWDLGFDWDAHSGI